MFHVKHLKILQNYKNLAFIKNIVKKGNCPKGVVDTDNHDNY